MSFTSNYSFKNLVKQIRNYEFLNDSSSTSTRNFSLSLCIDLELERLDLQSEVFSDNFIQHGYIEFSKTLRCKHDEVKTNLKNLYIYSFVKSLYNGLFFENISSDTKQGLCFRGHAAFYQILRNPNLSIFHDNYSVMALIKLPNSIEKKILMSLILRKYDFLSKGITNIDSYGNSPFIHTEWESKMHYLNDSHTSRMNILNVESGEKDKLKNDGGSISKPKNNDGRLVMLELTNDVASSIVNEINNPITNVLLKKNGDTLYFVPVNDTYQIENNCSFFFNLANFIRLNDSSDKDLNKYYSSNPYSLESKKFFIASEVFTNTGIKCKTIYSGLSGTSKPIFLPKVEDIISRVIDNPNLSIENITNIINELISNYEKEISSKTSSK